jgi:hypothetical protein
MRENSTAVRVSFSNLLLDEHEALEWSHSHMAAVRATRQA